MKGEVLRDIPRHLSVHQGSTRYPAQSDKICAINWCGSGGHREMAPIEPGLG